MAKKNNVNVENVTRTQINAEEALKRVQQRNCDNSSRCNSDNFRNLEFSDVEFTGADLSSSCFDYSKLTNVTFRDCNLQNVEFNFAEMENVRMIQCQLGSAEFHYAKLNEVKIYRSQVRSAEFDFAQGQIEFHDCHMEYVEWHNIALDITLDECNSQRGEFYGGQGFSIHAKDSFLIDTMMNDTIIHGKIENCDCTGMELKNSNCLELVFKGGSLRGIETEDTVGFNERCAEDEDEDEKEMDEIFK